MKPPADQRPNQTQAERLAMMEVYDSLPREVRMCIAFGPGWLSLYGCKGARDALRAKGNTAASVIGYLRMGFRGCPGEGQYNWKRMGYQMPYPHVGANATVMYTEPFDVPKDARERLMARRTKARMRLPPPNPIREVTHVASGVICL